MDLVNDSIGAWRCYQFHHLRMTTLLPNLELVTFPHSEICEQRQQGISSGYISYILINLLYNYSLELYYIQGTKGRNPK